MLPEINFDPRRADIDSLTGDDLDRWVLVAVAHLVHTEVSSLSSAQLIDVREELAVHESLHARLAGSLRRQRRLGLVERDLDTYGNAYWRLTDAGVLRAGEIAPDMCPAAVKHPKPEWMQRVHDEMDRARPASN